MSFIDKFLANLGTTKVGQDHFGNEYCISGSKDYLGRKKRFVIYNGLNLSSKVPPLWHAWLHYLSDEIPDYDEAKLSWQKEAEPNLTGTKYAYDPSELSDKSPVYDRWMP